MMVRLSRFRPLRLLTGFALAGFLCFYGCGMSSFINQLDLGRAESDILKKKIWIAGFYNHSFYNGQPSMESILPEITGYIKKNCSSFLVVKPGDVGFADKNVKLKKIPGRTIDNFDLAQTGRTFGLNNVVVVTLNDLDPQKNEIRVLGLHETFYKAKLLLTLQVWDVETASKIVATYFEPEIDLSEDEYNRLSKKESKPVKSIDEEIKEISLDIAHAVCDVTTGEEWKGFIVSVDRNKVTLSSGKEVQVKEGAIFNVFSKGKVLDGPASEKFQTPGVKIAEVKVTRVLDGKSEADIISGQGVTTGCTLKPKL